MLRWCAWPVSCISDSLCLNHLSGLTAGSTGECGDPVWLGDHRDNGIYKIADNTHSCSLLSLLHCTQDPFLMKLFFFILISNWQFKMGIQYCLSKGIFYLFMRTIPLVQCEYSDLTLRRWSGATYQCDSSVNHICAALFMGEVNKSFCWHIG